MLNSNKERELAYLVKIDAIEPIMGSDNCEAAIIGGWRVMIKKETFKPGDLAIYFEIDSKVPAKEPFAFLEKKHYKIKTQKYTFGGKGNFISQGLIMSPSDFGWEVVANAEDKPISVSDTNGDHHRLDDESRFLTSTLGVTYAVVEDNKRKAKENPNAKYNAMAARHKELFKKPIFRWLMRRLWGRKLLFFFFGKKKDNPKGFPTHFEHIHKTDEERVENMTWVLEDKSPLILTEKLDGTSCTYILERKKRNKFEFYVCSRNVRMLNPDQECFHESNIYWDMAEKYDIENKLKDYLEKFPELKYVCIQGEGVGNVQGNPLGLEEDDLYLFNFIRSDIGRVNSLEGKSIAESLGMKWVPIIDTNYVLPNTMEEFKLFADGKSVVNPEKMREGFVLRNPKTGLSFKSVSREYILSKDN